MPRLALPLHHFTEPDSYPSPSASRLAVVFTSTLYQLAPPRRRVLLSRRILAALIRVLSLNAQASGWPMGVFRGGRRNAGL